MKTLLPLQSQDVRRRGPARHEPLCHPKLRPKQDPPAIVPKIHLSYIPPSLRRPSPWGAFLSDWLASCEEKKAASSGTGSGSPPPSPSPTLPEEDEACSSRSSSSGACSGDTATTDFSSVSSPRKAAAYRTENLAPQPRSYPARLPRPASTPANLSPAQWAELLLLQQAAARQRQCVQPPKLMNIHTAYFPALDAAALQMMRPAAQQVQQQQQPASLLQASSPHPSHPWQPHSYYYPTDQRYSIRGASTASSDSAHFSDCVRDRTQSTCDFCYQFAVHEAVVRAAHLPRLTDKGPWRGHATKEAGSIVCPRLLRRVCSLCGATGQAAHLTNYCPTTNRKTARY